MKRVEEQITSVIQNALGNTPQAELISKDIVLQRTELDKSIDF